MRHTREDGYTHKIIARISRTHLNVLLRGLPFHVCNKPPTFYFLALRLTTPGSTKDHPIDRSAILYDQCAPIFDFVRAMLIDG